MIITVDLKKYNISGGTKRCFCAAGPCGSPILLKNTAVYIGNTDDMKICSDNCAQRNNGQGCYDLVSECSVGVNACYDECVASRAVNDDGETGLSCIEPCKIKWRCN